MASLSDWWSALKQRFKRVGMGRTAPPVPPSLPPAVTPTVPIALSAPQPPPIAHRVKATLALQGGGAHGAFTWGVLEALLADGRFDFVAVSGASAGAMNGAMLLQGLATGGPDGACALLETFWRRVAAASGAGAFTPSPLSRLLGNWNVDHSPAAWAFEHARRWMSPYDLHPAAYHPLRNLLADVLDESALRAAPAEFYVSATDVASGGLRIFRRDEIGVEALLASACLPHLFQAVRIDGRDYWDGGYLANPALFPLVEEHGDADLILITVNPFDCPETPRRPDAISARLAQITLNAPLRRELDGLNGVAGLRLHHIEAGAALRGVGHYSKLSADWGFLSWLRDAGRDAGVDWLNHSAPRLRAAAALEVA